MFERQSETLATIVSEYRSAIYERMPWRVVPAARLMRIWTDSAKAGFVRDTKGLARIEEIFVENVLRLSVNTEISGHAPVSPEDVLEGYFEPDEIEAFVDWAIDTPTGWRISDYGLGSLFELAALAIETNDPEHKLVVLDRMLNVIHPRSDLSSWLVEGGQRTLCLIHEGDRPSERADKPQTTSYS